MMAFLTRGRGSEWVKSCRWDNMVDKCNWERKSFPSFIMSRAKLCNKGSSIGGKALIVPNDDDRAGGGGGIAASSGADASAVALR